MKNPLKFFMTLKGQLVLAGVLCVFAVVVVVIGYNQRKQAIIPQKVRDEAQAKQQASLVPSFIKETGQMISELALPVESAPKADEGPKEPVIPEEVRKQMLAMPEPLTLINRQVKSPEPKPRLGQVYAPYGRLIPCRLINAVDSANIETPLIGIVTEDVWNRDENGVAQKVIAMGDEVHASASKGRMRDRIEVNGTFVFVRRNTGADNGYELTINGLALNRSFDEKTGSFGLDDGSAGIKGMVVETSSLAELKLFASTFISGISGSFKSTRDIFNPLTNQNVVSPESNLRNGAISGAEAVMNEYAQRIRQSIDRDGYYVAVRPGTAFYVYVKQTINYSEAGRGLRLPEDRTNQPNLK